MRSLVLTDLPVAVLLLAGWLSVPLGTIGHVAVGALFVGSIVVHLATRHKLAQRLWRAVVRTGRGMRQRITTWTAIITAVVMTVSGALQWAGVPSMQAVHSTSSYLVMIAAGVHVWQRRRALGRP